MSLALLLGLALGVIVGFALATARQAGLLARAKAAEDKVVYVEQRLAEHFESLSAKALDASNQRFLELADTRLKAAGAEAAGELEQRKQAVEHLIGPLRETLAKVETQLREVETGRRESHAMLAKQVEFVRQSSDQLRRETQGLVRALQRPEARGRWGELQLRRVVEIAGMAHHCDFDEQATAVTDDGAVRPDLVVRLAGDKNIIVDSKVSLAAYLEAAAAEDDAVRSARLAAHARHLRDHVDRLAAKAYWQAFSPAPPTTLITMLRTAGYAWQQEALSRNARAVFELGKELYERLGTMGAHVDELGRSLSNAIRSYNRTVGSLESRVLVSARRLNDLGVVEGGLEPPRPVEESARSLSAPELLGEDGPCAPPRPEAAEPVGFLKRAIPDQQGPYRQDAEGA
jgi:DNA anti-recombination protein RmuC